MAAAAPVLAGVGRVHGDIRATGPCCLEAQHRRKRGPRGITDALGEAVVMDHPADGEILHRDHLKPIDDPVALLVSEILPLPAHPLVNASHHLAPLLTLGRALRLFGEPLLYLRPRLLLPTEEAGVLNRFARRAS